MLGKKWKERITSKKEDAWWWWWDPKFHNCETLCFVLSQSHHLGAASDWGPRAICSHSQRPHLPIIYISSGPHPGLGFRGHCLPLPAARPPPPAYRRLPLTRAPIRCHHPRTRLLLLLAHVAATDPSHSTSITIYISYSTFLMYYFRIISLLLNSDSLIIVIADCLLIY